MVQVCGTHTHAHTHPETHTTRNKIPINIFPLVKGGHLFVIIWFDGRPPPPLLYPKEDWSNVTMFEKNFYLEHPAVTSRPESVVDAFRAAREMAVSGRDVPKPCTSFEEAKRGLSSRLRSNSHTRTHCTLHSKPPPSSQLVCSPKPPHHHHTSELCMNHVYYHASV